jgi:hypothetical protein
MVLLSWIRIVWIIYNSVINYECICTKTFKDNLREQSTKLQKVKFSFNLTNTDEKQRMIKIWSSYTNESNP